MSSHPAGFLAFPGTKYKHVPWLLPATAQPQDIDGLAKFAQAITYPSTSGCWGEACCECPFNPVDETPEESEQRTFDCLWKQLRADMDSGSDEDLSSQGFPLGSTFSSSNEAYDNRETYEQESTESEAGEDGYEETDEDEYGEGSETANEHEEILRGQVQTESGEHGGNGSGQFDWASDDFDEEEIVETEDSVDEELVTDIANAMFRGNRARAVEYIKNEQQQTRRETAYSESKSKSTENFRAISVRSPVRSFKQAKSPAFAPLSSKRTLKDPSSMHRASDVSSKRKRASTFKEDLDDGGFKEEDDYKNTKKRSVGFAQAAPETFSDANTGLDTQPSRKKARATPAKSIDSVETFPGGSTWSKVEGYTLCELLKQQRTFEKTHKLRPLHDAKLWKLLKDRLNRITGGNRTHDACKNFWNRYGRFHFDCDERGATKRSDSKVTSAQSSKARKVKQQTKEKDKTQVESKKEAEDHDDDDQDEDHAKARGGAKR